MATGDVTKLRLILVGQIIKHREDAETVDALSKALHLTRRTRHKAGRAAPTARSEDTMTDEEIRAVIKYARAFPHFSNRKIGRRFGIDGGRASEYLGSKKNARLDRLRAECA